MSRFDRPSRPRRHLAGKAAAIAAALALVWAQAAFQDAWAQDQSLMLGGAMQAGPLKKTQAAGNVAVDGFRADGAEPRDIAGMLQRQNETRHRAGLDALSWSDGLAAHVAKTVEAAMQPVCNQSALRRIAGAEGYASYWVAPLRRIDGTSISRTVSAPYIVSEWNTGAADYVAATATCRRGGSCDSYRPMMSPKAKLVGCARMTCSSGAQAFACGYAPALKGR